MKLSQLRLPRSNLVRAAISLLFMALVVVLFLWRGPSLTAIGDAFTRVEWHWVALAIAINLASVVFRALAWRTVIRQALPPPHPGFMLVFSAFSVGLFANAVLPGRIGELARVAVLNRKLPRRRGTWATLVGTVFAHRVFDLVPVLLLILYVIATAKIPAWAITSLLVVVGVGIGLFTFAFASARRPNSSPLDGIGAARRILTMARQGLGVMRSPVGATVAILFQCAGWLCQLLAVYTAMRAFHIHAPLPAAALVLLLMNVATIFPLWPGNVGLVQVAIATPLKASYGVAYAHGVAFGFGLQAIEASVGIGVGLLFLAREGLSFAMLRVMPSAAQAELDHEQNDREPEESGEPERARVSG
ncbi:MAG TPA: lysylphosphatidylglycerol synthase transmembrane domain-containing protein [Gaiellaceae bacterium]